MKFCRMSECDQYIVKAGGGKGLQKLECNVDIFVHGWAERISISS